MSPGKTKKRKKKKEKKRGGATGDSLNFGVKKYQKLRKKIKIKLSITPTVIRSQYQRALCIQLSISNTALGRSEQNYSQTRYLHVFLSI